MTKEKLDKLIEQERWETFDSINPGYHGDLLKALVELKNIQESCKDCISREAVLAMSDYIGETPTYDDPLGKVEEVVRVKDIMALPPVTPARKKGKWTNGDPICPCCGEDKFKDLDADLWADWQPKYCPNCGAEMEAADGN